ncbi:hypothetical protein [Saccharopolyspora sp. SCSIO 74807]|uniref:hypothetical protein n=1 Tax=Saccharopolyspora sp. SCSIO 74807 TaxID=3118084 RepID=UPI0030D5A2DB
MSASAIDSYGDVAEVLSPSVVAQYLAAHDWRLELRDPVKEIWRLPSEGDLAPQREPRIMLPLATDFVDFQRRFKEVLYSLGQVYDWGPSELCERISGARADMFYVRLDQDVLDGTISFRQAEKSVESLYKLLKAAATTAYDPYHSHRGGKRSAPVSNFLEDDVRLGHTKRGSFVFTVAARLGDLPDRDKGAAGKSFARKAMETLARGLETTRDVSRAWDPSVLRAPGERGVSASLVESLEELTQSESLRSLDLSFCWSPFEPKPAVGLEAIVLDRQLIGRLPGIRERLIRQEQPPHRETLVGYVRSLSRDEFGYPESNTATIQLSVELNGRVRTVHVTLDPDGHRWAIMAYQEKLPFTVTGDLVFERRAWRLVGDVEVDAEYLEFRREH